MTVSISKMQNRVESIEGRLESMVDQKLEIMTERLCTDLHMDMHEKIREEMQGQGNLLWDQL